MPDASPPRTHVNTTGLVTLRQRPSLLLMTVPLRATEATLELGLTKLKKQCEAASQWLQRLNAVRVEFGEPHFAAQANKDPLKQMRAVTAQALARRSGKPASGERRREVRVVLTAAWDIGALTAEETLVLVDRLQFEAADDPGVDHAAEEPAAWSSPEEQLHNIMAQMAEPVNDHAPQFLFVAQLSEEQLEKAAAEGFLLARRDAERLARAMGGRLGPLVSLHCSADVTGSGRADKLMERQRCGALLADSAYNLGEHEVVSDDPRSAEFTFRVQVSYQVDGPETTSRQP